ncbi:MAG: FMN-binding protein [Methylophilaceae bacterium]
MNRVKKLFCLLFVGLWCLPLAQALEIYLTPEQFLSEVFASNIPKPEVLWISKDIAKSAEKILGHAPAQLRQRYWKNSEKSVWILEEIGKEEPITAAYMVTGGKLAQVKVLAYRESRGGEVRYPAFLKQYQGAELKAENYLNRTIDGISGATLSVSAMTRMARLALYFDRVSRSESP